jgi:hypothetical protein
MSRESASQYERIAFLPPKGPTPSASARYFSSTSKCKQTHFQEESWGGGGGGGFSGHGLGSWPPPPSPSPSIKPLRRLLALVHSLQPFPPKPPSSASARLSRPARPPSPQHSHQFLIANESVIRPVGPRHHQERTRSFSDWAPLCNWRSRSRRGLVCRIGGIGRTT